MPTNALLFGHAAQVLAAEARRRGLGVPAFASPPRSPALPRAIRRLPGGGLVVAVRLRERDPATLVADMVDGLLVANGLAPPAAARLRPALVTTVLDALGDAVPAA